jgi:hypothetical protein
VLALRRKVDEVQPEPRKAELKIARLRWMDSFGPEIVHALILRAAKLVCS